MYHHDGDALEAHLTVVFAALAVARDLQARAGVSLKKLVRAARPSALPLFLQFEE